MRKLSFSLSILALTGTLWAQVPRGSAIVSNFNNLAPMEGLLLVTRAGVTTVVTGLAANPRGPDLNSVKLDPIDNRVWTGGINAASSGRLHYLTVAGTTVAGVTQHGPQINAGSIAGIAFDANCNPVVCTGAISAASATTGVFRIHRTTGALTQIAGGPVNGWPFPTGTANCITSDPAGNIYFGVTVGTAPMQAPIYSIAAPNYTTVVFEGWCVPPSNNTTISGMTWAPDAASPRGAIYWTTFAASTGVPVGKLILSATPPVASVAIASGLTNAANWIEYDNDVGDFWLVTGGIDPDTIYTMPPAGGVVQRALVPPGGLNSTPSCIDVNDCPPGRLTISPAYVPVPPAPFTAEIGVCCEAGDTAVYGIISPLVLILGVAVAGPDGRVWASYPNINLPPGTPGALTFLAGCVNTTGQVTLTSPVSWPRN
jgi:hypothetical protein